MVSIPHHVIDEVYWLGFGLGYLHNFTHLKPINEFRSETELIDN